MSVKFLLMHPVESILAFCVLPAHKQIGKECIYSIIVPAWPHDAMAKDRVLRHELHIYKE